MGPAIKIYIISMIWISLISSSFADKDLKLESQNVSIIPEPDKGLENQNASISEIHDLEGQNVSISANNDLDGQNVSVTDEDNDLEGDGESFPEDNDLEGQSASIPFNDLEIQRLEIIANDLESRSLAMAETSSNISSTSLGATCNSELFEKHAAVHITQASTSHEYNEVFQRMKVEINNTKYNSTDVCFHNKYFLECSIVTHKCECARTGIWKNFNFVKVGDHCYVGGNGRCHPNKTRHLICVNGTTCKKSDEKYDKRKPQYKCSGSESSFYQIQKVTLWTIFAGVALLWRE